MRPGKLASRVFAKVLRASWVRIASSVQSWVEDPLETHIALGAGCAGLQTIIIQRKQGDFGGV